MAAKDKDGYGLMWDGTYLPSGVGKMIRVPRFSLQLQLGRLLVPGEIPRHDCDNPPCVSPFHLRSGNQVDNEQDKLLRGRNVLAARTHCKNDHEFTEENTRWRADGRGRTCKQCIRDIAARQREKNRCG